MELVKNQHYVPRFYLKAFSYNRKMVFVFDKFLKKSFRSSIDKVAAEHFFYELLPVPNGSQDTQAVEKLWSGLEAGFARIIRELLDEVRQTGRFTPGKSERNRGLAAFLIMQAIRTREYREYQNDIIRQVKGFYAELVQGARSSTDATNADRATPLSDDMSPLEHAKLMFNLPFIESVMTILFEHIWIVGENRTSQPLFTSDAPIIRYSHARPYPGSGFASPGIEILLPLSSRYILVLLDRPYFKRSEYLTDGIVHQLIPEQVVHYNASQVRDSYRQVYCEEDRFDLAWDYIEQYPEVCDRYRQKVKIER
jgi:Protein of unknown function (DUF4238)